MNLRTVTVHIVKDGVSLTLTCQPDEAFAIVTMPAFAGLVTMMVPEYGMPSLCGSADQE